MLRVREFARRHPPPQRLLGLDIGDKYVGVAVCDPTQTVASAPLKQPVIRLPDNPLDAIGQAHLPPANLSLVKSFVEIESSLDLSPIKTASFSLLAVCVWNM